MTDDYIKKLVELAKEIHEIQLESSNKLKGQTMSVNFEAFSLTSKINYLIGYIMALEERNSRGRGKMKKYEDLKLNNLMNRWHNGDKRVPYEKVLEYVNRLIEKRLKKAVQIYEDETFCLISDLQGSYPTDGFLDVLVTSFEKQLKE